MKKLNKNDFIINIKSKHMPKLPKNPNWTEYLLYTILKHGINEHYTC